jgi:pimeloyl-ACP methyl ester carboxylesterase
MTHLNPIISVNPIIFQVPNRQVDLEIKVTAPVNGENLPVIIFSHGHGASNFLSSYRGYAPFADFFASHGFVVIQPTHLNSKTLALDPTGPEGPLFWKSRPKDMKFILDNLDEIISSVPSLIGRVNTENVAAIGHSLGGITVAMLAGMEITDPVTGEIENFADSRLKARVMIGVTGSPKGLTGQIARNNFPFLLGINFGTMTLPALVVNGDKDKNLAFSDVDNWRADAYYDSPTPKSLLTVFGAEHIFGGISGYDALETSDENPERVAFVCSSIMTYLREAFNPNDTSWKDLKKELNDITDAKGRIDSK